MFGLKKTKIRRVENNLCVSQHHNYNKIIEAIRLANIEENPNTLEFNRIKNSFPKIAVKKANVIRRFKLEKNMVGFVIVEVSLGGQILKFILDTGAQISCIHSKFVGEVFGIINSEEEINVSGAGSTYGLMRLGCIKLLSALSLEIRNLPVLILNEDQLNISLLGNTLTEVDGILGWDVLRLMDFEIDFTGLKLNIITNHNDHKCRNFYQSDYPVVLCMDAQARIRVFGIDTGAKHSWINESLIEENGLLVASRKNKTGYSVHGQFVEETAIIKRFVVDILNKRLTFKKIRTGNTNLLNDYEFDGLLGQDICQNHKIVFLNSQQVFYIE